MWDIGGVRNYCLLLASLVVREEGTIVFLDDDIVTVPKNWGRRRRGGLTACWRAAAGNANEIIGPTLRGVPDQSALEREMLRVAGRNGQRLGLPRRPSPISGGFLAFSPVWARKYCFPRSYNEDWIWLLRCRQAGARLRRIGTRAWHLGTPGSDVALDRLVREQVGELFCIGWHKALKVAHDCGAAYCLLRQEAFWRNVIRLEQRYLQDRARALGGGSGQRWRDSRVGEFVKVARDAIASTGPCGFAEMAAEYVSMDPVWRIGLRRAQQATEQRLFAPLLGRPES